MGCCKVSHIIFNNKLNMKDNTNIVPPNVVVRKATAKKTFSLADFKKKAGCEDVPDKPLTWLRTSAAMEKATGLPGFAKGYVNLCRGFSNTGKSTAVCEGIVAAQKDGDLVIIIDTENNMGMERLVKMGFDINGEYILIDNEYLLTNFGKKQDKDRNEASIEDLAKCMYYFMDEQNDGNLDRNITFAIDSIGTLNCIATINAQVKETTANNMWNAKAYETCFLSMLNNTIPNSRKIDKPYINTVIAVQKIWIDNMNGGGVKHKGGETFYFGSRLIYHFGGIIAHGTKKIMATSKKRDVNYGIEARINVAKNHIDGPLGGISMEGKIISTPHGFVYPDDLEIYKKKYILFFRNIFNDDTMTSDDLTFEADDVEFSEES